MAKVSKPANTALLGNKRKANKTTWKKGQPSPNPAGRPKDGESWAGVLRWAAELTGTEAAAVSPPELAREFRKLGKLKLKHAVTLRTFAAMLFEPSSGLFNAMMDRAEGKIPDKLEVYDWRQDVVDAGLDPDALASELFAKVSQVNDANPDA